MEPGEPVTCDSVHSAASHSDHKIEQPYIIKTNIFRLKALIIGDKSDENPPVVQTINYNSVYV